MKNIIFGVLGILVLICVFIQISRFNESKEPFYPTPDGKPTPEMVKTNEKSNNPILNPGAMEKLDNYVPPFLK